MCTDHAGLNAPSGAKRWELHRLALGDSFVRPTANVEPQPAGNENAIGPAQVDAALGITAAENCTANAPPTVPRSCSALALVENEAFWGGPPPEIAAAITREWRKLCTADGAPMLSILLPGVLVECLAADLITLTSAAMAHEAREG
eukprot:s2805_g10.t1